MVTNSSKSLVDVLQESQLLQGRELEQATRLQERFPDAKGLSAQLMRAGWLTPFQVNQLLQGRCADLVLGPYRILERLGVGGMGEVFKARHEGMQRIVALKVIRKEKVADPVTVGRFRQEARAAAQLSHPNIVTLYDASSIGDTHYMAMEYVEGTDLARLVKESGALPVRQACDFVRQAALGLQHAQERGLVHRDIKPSNLLVTKDDVVKVLDMGLARLHGSGAVEDPALTQAGYLVGTPDFMAPEQAKNSRTVDARADIYSLGCTLYYLLTGRPPFDGATAVEKLLKHQMEEMQPIRKLRPAVPAELEKVLRKLMAKRPEDRFANAAAAAAALLPFSSDSQPVLGRRSGMLQRRWLIAAGLAGVLLLGIGLSAFSGSKPQQLEPTESSSPPASSEHRDSGSDAAQDPGKSNGHRGSRRERPDWFKKKDGPPKDMPPKDLPR